MSMPVTERMSICVCMLMSMTVVVPTVIVSLHRPHLT
jgi:hypothetical protein